MRKVIIMIWLVMGFVFSVPGCTKDQDTKDQEYEQVSMQKKEKLSAVEHSIYGVDSIFYSGENIGGFSEYKMTRYAMVLENSYILTRKDNEIHVKIAGDVNETDMLVFNGSELTEILFADNRLILNFFYENDKLKYFLYRRNDVVDSIAVSLDNKNKNIKRMEWYRLGEDYPILQFSSDYTYDDKINPFYNSIYWIVKNWKGLDDVALYFNSNNVLSMGSHMFSYVYNDSDYPVHMDFPIYGRTTFHYLSDPTTSPTK